VWRVELGVWVEGVVLGVRTGTDGTMRYFVKLLDHAPGRAANPNSWFSTAHLRSADGVHDPQ
jgi:hypothetical protein